MHTATKVRKSKNLSVDTSLWTHRVSNTFSHCARDDLYLYLYAPPFLHTASSSARGMVKMRAAAATRAVKSGTCLSSVRALAASSVHGPTHGGGCEARGLRGGRIAARAATRRCLRRAPRCRRRPAPGRAAAGSSTRLARPARRCSARARPAAPRRCRSGSAARAGAARRPRRRRGGRGRRWWTGTRRARGPAGRIEGERREVDADSTRSRVE